MRKVAYRTTIILKLATLLTKTARIMYLSSISCSYFSCYASYIDIFADHFRSHEMPKRCSGVISEFSSSSLIIYFIGLHKSISTILLLFLILETPAFFHLPYVPENRYNLFLFICISFQPEFVFCKLCGELNYSDLRCESIAWIANKCSTCAR